MARHTATLAGPARRSSDLAPGTGPGAFIEAGELEWRRLSWSRRAWLLCADGRRLGVLEVRGALREHIRLDGPSGAWEVRRNSWSGAVDLLHPAFPSVHYSRRLVGRDSIRCASASRYAWGRVQWWHSEWQVSTESGFPLVRFLRQQPLRGTAFVIQIEPMARRLGELEPLVLLGAYLLTRTRGLAH